MKPYVLSLAAGVMVGLIYSLINVRSPAPPMVALVGLLGILIGEQVPAVAASVWRNEPLSLSWISQIKPHVFGHLPRGGESFADPGEPLVQKTVQDRS